MATNPIGPGTTNVTVNMPKTLREELKKLADTSGMKLGPYICAVAENAVKDGAVVERALKLTRSRPVNYRDLSKAAEEPPAAIIVAKRPLR